jgi:hypothetical protein
MCDNTKLAVAKNLGDGERGARKKIKWKGKSLKLHYQGTKGKVALVRYLSY